MLGASCCRISLGFEPGVEALPKKVGVAKRHLLDVEGRSRW